MIHPQTRQCVSLVCLPKGEGVAALRGNINRASGRGYFEAHNLFGPGTAGAVGELRARRVHLPIPCLPPLGACRSCAGGILGETALVGFGSRQVSTLSATLSLAASGPAMVPGSAFFLKPKSKINKLCLTRCLPFVYDCAGLKMVCSNGFAC